MRKGKIGFINNIMIETIKNVREHDKTYKKKLRMFRNTTEGIRKKLVTNQPRRFLQGKFLAREKFIKEKFPEPSLHCNPHLGQ